MPILPEQRWGIFRDSAQCVAFWGVADPTGAAAHKILAYEKGAPRQGGLVVYGDGTVKNLTASEFQTAPKAGS